MRSTAGPASSSLVQRRGEARRGEAWACCWCGVTAVKARSALPGCSLCSVTGAIEQLLMTPSSLSDQSMLYQPTCRTWDHPGWCGRSAGWSWCLGASAQGCPKTAAGWGLAAGWWGPGSRPRWRLQWPRHRLGPRTFPPPSRPTRWQLCPHPCWSRSPPSSAGLHAEIGPWGLQRLSSRVLFSSLAHWTQEHTCSHPALQTSHLLEGAGCTCLLFQAA